MTRPNIVRADTLDLQDEDHPTAAEHTKPNLQGGLAPHQRAEVHHVLEERVSEEHALEDAWNIADNLTDEPDAIDQAQHQQQQNGGQQGQTNGQQAGGEGSEEGDADDDMMDRISSSPSIDDGGYLPHSSPPSPQPRGRTIWPVRSSSLTPSPRNTPTPTRETFNQSSSSPTDSSPFLQTPQHLPLQARRAEREASRLASHIELSSSPFDHSPRHLPTIMVERANDNVSFTSEHHHSRSRYMDSQELEPVLETEDDDDSLLAPSLEAEDEDVDMDATNDSQRSQHGPERIDPQDYRRGSDRPSASSVLIHDIDQDLRPIESPFRTHNFSRNTIILSVPHLEESPSLNSIASVDLKDLLLPIDDPLLDTPPSPTDDADSWESLSSDSGSLDESTNDDDTDALFADLEPRFIDSGWGGECLRETEDIDFEFVYALHTFVATVEGQANATKGDTMVLLDDSNSYWWLVRVVKDASIGYLPAEHIETPTERLARLNKHRNIDLSATMLSDNSEKSRNPIKKAMRRRNAKTVQFAAPTYVEASDYDYDTEDEDQPPAEEQTTTVQVEEVQQNGEQHEEEPIAEKRTSHDEGIVRTSSSSSRLSFDREQAATLAANTDEPQLSPKLVDKTEAAPLKSKRTRNTDSFLKDDNIETRKITLTPGLLREESAGKSSTSTDSTRNASLENIVSSIQQPQPLSKKDSKKEKKEKKPGMLSGLFKSKKKDKKAVDSGSLSDVEKPSNEYQRESPSRSPLTSGRASPVQQDVSSLVSPLEHKKPEVQTRQPTRGKLQKTLPSGSSPVREGQVQEQSAEFVAELQGSEAAVEMGAAEPSPPLTQEEEPVQRNLAEEDKEQNDGPLSPITNLLKRDDSKTQKPTKAKKAKERMELDDFDSPSEEDGPNPFKEQEERAATTEGDDDAERLSESPIEITHNTFMHGTEIIHIPTPGPDDQGEDEEDEDEDEDEEPESLTSSPSIIEHPAEPLEPNDNLPDDDLTPTAPRSPSSAAALASTPKPAETPTRELSVDSVDSSTSNHLTPSTSASQQSWSDSSLRAWLEDGSEVKDMMVLIHDTSDVKPVGEDHPLMVGLFTEQRRGVQGLMAQLDGLLGSYLQRKGIELG